MPPLFAPTPVHADGCPIEAKAHTNGSNGARALAQSEPKPPRLKREPDMEKLVAVFTLAAAVIGTALSTLLNSAA